MNGTIRSTFCSIETVSCVTGFTNNRICDLVECGYFLWVWNVSSGIGARRELRFWSRELCSRTATTKLSLDYVVGLLIPRRSEIPGQYDGLRSWEFRHLLRLSKPSFSELRNELGVQGTTRNFFIPRENLEQFLRHRWLGNISPRSNSIKAK